jgi:hypothetical protein
MIQRRKPLTRSTKPLKRKAITRKPTKRRLAVDAQLTTAKDFYFKNFGHEDGTAPCQHCRIRMDRPSAHAHHKIKRSLWATAMAEERQAMDNEKHGKKNQVVICEACHVWIHAKPERLDAVRRCSGNSENGLGVVLTFQGAS